MADIIPFQRKPEPPKKTEDDYTWFIHECVNVEFFLRSDGFIVCTKCGEEIGYYTLYGHD
jgi:hypothetical protein